MIDGLPADVVALALPLDVQKIADAGLLREDWRKRFPLQSVGAQEHGMFLRHGVLLNRWFCGRGDQHGPAGVGPWMENTRARPCVQTC